jgi:hypothetical protein
MPIKRKYFETPDYRQLDGQAWVPLRRATDTKIEPPSSDIEEIREFIGIATAAVEVHHRKAAEKLGWGDLDLDYHRSGVEDGGYSSADFFRDGSRPIGVNLIIDQYVEHEGCHIWHLHPDLVVAIDLLREGDSWYRPEEGWVEVVRLRRDSDHQPVLVEIRKEFLGDYLAARKMALYCSSYCERVMLTPEDPMYGWPDDRFSAASEHDRREAYTTSDHFGTERSRFRTMGCLWRTEWVEPSFLSVRVRGDKDPHVATFSIASDGTRVEADRLAGAMAWLYFEPTLALSLLRHRSGSLGWYTGETGMIGATAFGVHFGVNDLGLITAYAKDVGSLKTWEQRLWSAHNVTPDGGVSKELFAAQMEVRPASTVAPEHKLKTALEALDTAFEARHRTQLLRPHDSVPTLFRSAHRFQAAESGGLLELAKDLTRLLIERIDVDAVLAVVTIPKGDRKPGSLKALERLVGHHRTEAEAKVIMAPLFGLYDLRLADAHLGSSNIASALERAKVDDGAPMAMQGRQLIGSFVDTIQAITNVLNSATTTAAGNPPASGSV